MTEENEPLTVGLVTVKHDPVYKKDKTPTYKVVMKSLDAKITVNIELPDIGRQIFYKFPLGEVVEVIFKEPSQLTLDQFKETDEIDE